MEMLRSTLQAQAPARKVTRSFHDFAQRAAADLDAGIYTVLAQGESNFPNYVGRQGEFGILAISIIGQIKLAEDSEPSAVEDAEFLMAAEIKALTAAPPAGIDSLLLHSYRQSSQLEHPYGWIAFDMEMLV